MTRASFAGRAGLVALFAMLGAACTETGVIPRHQVAGGDPSRARPLIVHYGCGSCHVIPGVPAAEGLVGPPLTAVASRSYLAGDLPNEAEMLVRWIRFPQSLHPGTVMPDLGVTDPHARDIAAYLYTLSADRLGPPHPVPARHLPGH